MLLIDYLLSYVTRSSAAAEIARVCSHSLRASSYQTKAGVLPISE